MALVWCFAAMSMWYQNTKQSSSSSVPWVLGWEVMGSLFKTRSGQNTVFWWGGQVPEQRNAKVLSMKEPYTQLLSEGWQQQQLNVLPFPVFVALCVCAHVPLGKQQMLPLPSLFLTNTRSLINKMDELRLQTTPWVTATLFHLGWMDDHPSWPPFTTALLRAC